MKFEPVTGQMKIEAIKAIKAITGQSLAEAKHAVETGQIEVEPHLEPVIREALRNLSLTTTIVSFFPIAGPMKIKVIKALREVTGQSLAELKHAVETGRIEVEPHLEPEIYEALRSVTDGRAPLAVGTWVVICLGRSVNDLSPDTEYTRGYRESATIANQAGFTTRADAVQYARTICASQRPLVAELTAP